VAIDAVGLAHLRIAGANDTIQQGSVWALPVLRRAVELDLGVTGLDDLRFVGATEAHEARVRAQLA
jgi:hypothetical protein